MCMVPGERYKVLGIRRRGRKKRRWLDSTRNDLSERELAGEDAQQRAKWMSHKTHRPHIKVGKYEEEEEEEEVTKV